MPVTLPDDHPSGTGEPPAGRITFTRTLYLNDQKLAALLQTSVDDELIKVRVRPSGYPKARHYVRLTVDADAENGYRIFLGLNEALRLHRIEHRDD